MRVSGSDIECGRVAGEGGVRSGLKEKDAVRFLEPRQVEQVCVLVEPVPDRMAVWEQDRESMCSLRDIL